MADMKLEMAVNGYDDCYDNSWHIIPPDYVGVEDDYRYAWVIPFVVNFDFPSFFSPKRIRFITKRINFLEPRQVIALDTDGITFYNSKNRT